MNRFFWRIANVVAQLLEPDERDAVCGDLAEAGAGGRSALREVLGIVVRRQLLIWTEWRPWLAMLMLAAPLGALLVYTVRWWAYTTAIYAWLYVDNWTWAYVQSAGSRGELERYVGVFLGRAAALGVASWASGFLIALLSRRAAWATGAVFLVIVAAFPDAPTAEQHAEIFSLTFYRVVLPLLARLVLIAIPTVWGMRVAARHAAPAGRRTLAS